MYICVTVTLPPVQGCVLRGNDGVNDKGGIFPQSLKSGLHRRSAFPCSWPDGAKGLSMIAWNGPNEHGGWRSSAVANGDLFIFYPALSTQAQAQRDNFSPHIY